MFPVNDALDAILVGAFFFGLFFTLGSLLLGIADVDFGHETDAGGADHGADHGGHFGGLFNISSLLAFITWFGGVGYLARNAFGMIGPLAVVVGLLGGLAGSAAISWFLLNVLRRNSQELDPRDWDQVGVIGRVTSSIGPSGFGEIVYEQQGVRLVSAARAEGERAIPRETEVVILRVEKGVAIVEPFDELLERQREPGPV
jgi:membrane protein implicated in regulation of membrane protease activity